MPKKPQPTVTGAATALDNAIKGFREAQEELRKVNKPGQRFAGPATIARAHVEKARTVVARALGFLIDATSNATKGVL